MQGCEQDAAVLDTQNGPTRHYLTTVSEPDNCATPSLRWRARDAPVTLHAVRIVKLVSELVSDVGQRRTNRLVFHISHIYINSSEAGDTTILK